MRYNLLIATALLASAATARADDTVKVLESMDAKLQLGKAEFAGGKTLDLEALRGKIVLLDFCTFCCINCLHVLDELRPLEAEFADVLVTIGVHSPKFVHEAEPEALEAAVERYAVEHAVLDDPELTTWQNYAVKAWPTLVLVDREGIVRLLRDAGSAATRANS